MKKTFSLLFCLFLGLCLSISVSKYYVKADEMLYLGGFPVGFSIYTNGVTVVGFNDVITKNGKENPAKKCDILQGDTIYSINGNIITCANDFEKSLNKDYAIIVLKRNNKKIIVSTKPALDIFNRYRLGVMIKDELNGLGTATFIKGNKIATLGHGIYDNNGELLDINKGNLYMANVTGYKFASNKTVGFLNGEIIQKSLLGTYNTNNINGVYATLKNTKITDNLTKIEKGDANVGKAFIYTTIDKEGVKKFQIEIIKTVGNVKIKNYVIRITDEKLINKTGGILQGMSGSPIVQNGKLVGAVTHVFTNNPKLGYGISIDNMLENI